MTLLKQQLRLEWVGVLVWGTIIAAMVLIVVVAGESMRVSGLLKELDAVLQSLPEQLRKVYSSGISAESLQAWLPIAFGGLLSEPMVIYTALFVARLVTREMDLRTMEFLLAQPVARWSVILFRWMALAGALLALHLFHLGAVVSGVLAIGERPEIGNYVVADLNSWLLFLAVGGLMLAVSILVDDYSKGIGTLLALGLGLYLFDIVADGATGWVGTIHGLMPFALFDPEPIIMLGQVPGAQMAALAAIAVVTLALAMLLFERKEIA